MIHEVESADGTSIVYRVTGPADGQVVVLLHGWAANLTCWGPVAVDLAQWYRVIAVDLRGHGYSGAPTSGYDDPEAWAADLDAVLTAEGVDAHRPAVLLGWSYGGLAVTDYLAERGLGAVAGVIYVGAIPSIGPDVPGADIGHLMTAAIPGVFSENPGKAVRAFALFGDANVGPGADKGPAAQHLFGAALTTPPRVRKALFHRSRDNNATLRTLDVPVLVIHGTADPIVDIATARHAASQLPKARTSFWPGAKHAPFIENPACFVAEVREFVDAIA